MKRLLLILSILYTGYCYVNAQVIPVLSYKTHVLKGETTNQMKLCNYADPGKEGKDVIWDFSNLQVKENFEGIVTSAYQTINSTIFPEAKIELDEFGNKFYFNTEENLIEQVGYLSKDGNVKMIYDRPLLKMKYPFTYGDNHTGIFSGKYIVNNQEIGYFEGTYEIKGDGYGTLILPGNFVAKNVLRVKTVQEYNLVINNSPQKNRITTYRWYSKYHRYPLLVFIKSEVIVNNNTFSGYQAALNNDVNLLQLKSESNLTNNNFEESIINIYPNPASDNINISFNLNKQQNVLIEIYDINGKKVATLEKAVFPASYFNKTYNIKNSGNLRGNFVVRVKTDEFDIRRDIIIVK